MFDSLGGGGIGMPTPKVPVVFCLDTSGSMNGRPMNELNAAVRMFFDNLRGIDSAMKSVEVAIITFGAQVTCTVPFTPIGQISLPTFRANGGTPMGRGADLALDVLAKHEAAMHRAGTAYSQPWVILVSDGTPSDDISSAAAAMSKRANGGDVSVFAIGVGPNADLKALGRFSPKRDAFRLQALKFQKFFEWLSKNITAMSKLEPGGSFQLDLGGLNEWAES